MAGHVSLDISWATDIHLDALLYHLGVASQSYVICVDSQLRNCITPFRPTFFCIVAFAHCLLEFMHQGKYLFLVRSGILPSLLQVLVGDLIESHFASSGSQRHNFPLLSQ